MRMLVAPSVSAAAAAPTSNARRHRLQTIVSRCRFDGGYRAALRPMGNDKCETDLSSWDPIYKISYDLSYDYRKFVLRLTYDSDLKRAEISLRNIVS